MRLRPILLLAFIAVLILPLFTDLSVAEYTTPVVWSNKKDYDPAETAYIYGYGFTASAQITVTIIRPDSVEDIVLTSTDEFGYFSCQYLLDGIHGTFSVTATDGLNIATTTFDNWLDLKAWWKSQDSIYIYANASGLSPSKQYYIKYFDPSGVEKRKSPTYTEEHSFTDNLTILPTFPNILGTWTVKLYENGNLKKTKWVSIDRIVWTTDSTYTTLVTSFAQGETVYFKTIGLKSYKYYRFKLERPDGTRFYVGSWTTSVTSMTGSYLLPSDAQLGTWILHVRQASDSSGTCEDHYVDCRFEVTTPPPPIRYYLTVRTDPPGIGTIPGQGWYNACTFANLTATEFFPGPDGTRYRFDYWDVDGVSQGIGIHEISIHMNASHTATAHYITQYYLTLTTSPSGVTTPAGMDWYDAGTNAPIFTPEFVSIVPGASRYRFNGWTTGVMSEIADPSAISTTVFMDNAKTVTANYVTQYKVTFDQTGLDESALNTIVTVDDSGKTYGELPYSFWVDSETVVEYTYNSIVSSSVLGKRFSLIDVSGPTSPITVTSAVTVTGNYKTQYLVSFTQTGSAVAPTVTYTADTDPTQTVPFGVWVRAGSEITYTYQDIVLGSPGVRYVFTGVNPASPQTVNDPLTITGNYKIQYYLTVDTNPAEVLTLNPAAVSGEGWYDSDFTATVDAVQNVDKVSGQSRYDFRSWTGATPTGVGNQARVLMDNPKTATANYQLQYYLTVSSPYGSPNPISGWFDDNKLITASVTSPSPGPPGTHYVCTGWNGMGSVPGSGTGSSVAFTITQPSSITWLWKTQYYLIVGTYPSGIVSIPGEGWYDPLTNVPLTAPSVAGYQFLHWEVDGLSQGDDVPSINVNMNEPHTATAYYRYLPSVPVGGYSISLTQQTPVSYITVYIMLIALFGAVLSLIKRKRK